MKWDVKAKDEEGNVVVEGYLNRKEVSFLLSYAVNSFLAQGVQFAFGDEDDDEPGENDEPRFKFPQND